MSYSLGGISCNSYYISYFLPFSHFYLEKTCIIPESNYSMQPSLKSNGFP